MSLITNASGDWIHRTANIPADNSFTMAGWFYRTSARGGYENFLSMNGGSGWTSFQFHNNFGGGPWRLAIGCTSQGRYEWTQTLPTGEWFYLAFCGNGTNITGYWYDHTMTMVGSPVSTSGASTVADHAELAALGCQTYNEWVDGKCAYVRVWDAALSQSEIEAEMASRRPVRTTNLNTAISSKNGVDVSGNGRDWTLNSITVDTDVPSGLTGIAFEQLAFNNNDAAGTSMTCGISNVSVGNRLVGIYFMYSGGGESITDITDDQSNVYNHTFQAQTDYGGGNWLMAEAPVTTGGTVTVTMSSQNHPYRRMMVAEYSGVGGIDVSNVAMGYSYTTATDNATVSDTPTGYGDLIIGIYSNITNESFAAAGTGYIYRGGFGDAAGDCWQWEDCIQATPATIAAPWTPSVAYGETTYLGLIAMKAATTNSYLCAWAYNANQIISNGY